MAPLKAGSIFQGRLARTIPDHSLRWPSAPGAAKRASTSMVFMSSSGGSILRKAAANSRKVCCLRRGVSSGLGSCVLAYSSWASWSVSSRVLWRSRVAPNAGSESRNRAVGTHVGHDKLAAPVDGQIGQADCEIPALAQHPLMADVEDLWGLPVGACEGVHLNRHLPRDAIVNTPTEKLRQL